MMYLFLMGFKSTLKTMTVKTTEKLYYACDYEPCCIYCGEYVHDVDEDDEIYPQCQNCTQDPVGKRK